MGVQISMGWIRASDVPVYPLFLRVRISGYAPPPLLFFEVTEAS